MRPTVDLINLYKGGAILLCLLSAISLFASYTGMASIFNPLLSAMLAFACPFFYWMAKVADRKCKGNDMTIITHPTYDELHLAANYLVSQIEEAGIKPDVIIGLVRGGTLPATIISHALNIPMIAIHYSAKDGAGDNKNHSNQLPNLSQYKTLLIVDDICDTGKTLNDIYKYYSVDAQPKHVLYSAVWYYKDIENGYVPDFFWYKIPQDCPWIIFPFEQANGNINRDEITT